MGNLRSALATDAVRRREKAEQKAAAPPPLELQAGNAVIQALSGLGAERALVVLRGIEKSLVEYLATSARAGF